MAPSGNWPIADHLGWPAGQHDLARLEMALRLHMHLGDKRAGGVHEDHTPPPRLGRHRLGHAMRRKHDRPVIGAIVQILDEHRPQPLQPLHHMPVVDNLMAHEHRRPPFDERLLNDLDGPVHARAKPARGGQQD